MNIENKFLSQFSSIDGFDRDDYLHPDADVIATIKKEIEPFNFIQGITIRLQHFADAIAIGTAIDEYLEALIDRMGRAWLYASALSVVIPVNEEQAIMYVGIAVPKNGDCWHLRLEPMVWKSTYYVENIKGCVTRFSIDPSSPRKYRMPTEDIGDFLIAQLSKEDAYIPHNCMTIPLDPATMASAAREVEDMDESSPEEPKPIKKGKTSADIHRIH